MSRCQCKSLFHCPGPLPSFFTVVPYCGTLITFPQGQPAGSVVLDHLQSARSDILLANLEPFFNFSHSRHLLLSALFLPGRADALVFFCRVFSRVEVPSSNVLQLDNSVLSPWGRAHCRSNVAQLFPVPPSFQSHRGRGFRHTLVVDWNRWSYSTSNCFRRQ